MSNKKMKFHNFCKSLLVLFAFVSIQCRGQDVPTAAPEKPGFSTERLKRLDTLMQQAIDDRQYGGIVALLARHGKVVRFESFGKPNATNTADDKSTIFRLASMSKPLTGAAMMILYDEGSGDEDRPQYLFPLNYRREPSLPSGGGGIVSTASDYFRFAQMLLNGGVFNGVRVLSPAAVKIMTSNHLPDNMTSAYKTVTGNVPRLGTGYSYDGAVVIDPAKAGLPTGTGTYLWHGVFGTWFWVDPVNDMVFVGMVQRTAFPGDKWLDTFTDLQELSRTATYQALLRPAQ
jgi:CubicO group peptidase (beta-lactamase class C family)